MGLFRPTIINPRYDVEAVDGFRPLSGITTVYGHQSGGPRDKTDAQARAITTGINAYHKSIGYGGIAYNYVVTVKGNIIMGRPVRQVPTATYKHNTDSIAILMLGGPHDAATRLQRRALRYIGARAHTTRFPSGWRVTKRLDKLRWLGHCDVVSTDCPGDFLPAYRSKGKRP